MMRRRAQYLLPTALACLSVLVACEEVEQIQDRFRDLTPHEEYLASLEDAGLGDAALARDWIAASRRALDEPLGVSLPFREQGFIAPEEAGATAYRVTVGRGQRLTAEVALEGDEGTRVFVDLFRVPEDPQDPLRPLLSSDSVPGTFVHEPMRGGDFVLRIQPELLRGGRYQVTLRLEAQLAFPVEGLGPGAIQSVFGDEREGGRRSHHGVDIFARRGTPVLATSDGVVSRVQVTRLGGKVVWLRDSPRNASVYYAHLDSQYVRDGQRVRTGDTLGFVGNSGNARTTPPHLHFGIYRRGEGPVDPDPFIRPPRGTLAELTADGERLGRWVRMADPGIRLRTAPSVRADVLRELEQHTPLRVLAGSGDWYRVRLPDGREGYVAARLTESVDRPVGTRVADAPEQLRTAPYLGAPVMAEVGAGQELPVLGRFGPYLYVQTPSGRPAWLDAVEDG
ncbi:MAG: peptidoglycan DD-metalloendopeptidase family protein [Longimicrobiales bacterium]